MTNLSFLVGCIRYGMIRIQNHLFVASVDINDLLSDEVAAGQGGALNEINNQVKEYGKGGFSIVRNAVIYIVAIALIAGAGAMAIHAGNAQKRDEDKHTFAWRFIAAIMAFAGVAILLFAQRIGEQLFRL